MLLTTALRLLWAVLYLDYLCSLETDSQISRALERMPVSLTETYSRIIEEINSLFAMDPLSYPRTPLDRA
jgi:hypothetical protein